MNAIKRRPRTTALLAGTIDFLAGYAAGEHDAGQAAPVPASSVVEADPTLETVRPVVGHCGDYCGTDAGFDLP